MSTQRKILFSGALALLALCACGDDNSAGPQSTATGYDFGPLLAGIADQTIIPTYQDLADQAGKLAAAVQALKTDPSAATLAAARASWVAARAPWEASEGFLFGPVDFKGYDPALDTWPVNRADLDAVLASDQVLSAQTVINLDNSLKGFHTIEYLLYGEGGTKTAADFSVRQYEYLVACTKLFAETATALHKSWIPVGGDFRAQFVGAGQGSNTYATQQTAIQELVNGLIGICDEVGNGKIAEPFTNQDPHLEESQFSFNSLIDFQNNIRSVWNVYTGGYQVEGLGLDEFVKNKNTALDQRLKEEIQTAIAEIGKISYPFHDAIATDAVQIQAAQQAIAKVKQSLEGEVLPLVLAQQ